MHIKLISGNRKQNKLRYNNAYNCVQSWACSNNFIATNYFFRVTLIFSSPAYIVLLTNNFSRYFTTKIQYSMNHISYITIFMSLRNVLAETAMFQASQIFSLANAYVQYTLRTIRKVSTQFTYIMSPADLVHPGIRLDVTLEVYIDSFSYRTGIQITSQFQTHNWHIWKQ
jgi:hypothetical protein